MFKYTLARIIQTLPTVFGVLLLTFALGFYGPGDPIQYQFGEQLPPDPEAVERLRELYGLNRPFVVQFGEYVWNLLQGDLGKSLVVFRDVPVSDMLFERLSISMQLGGISLLLLIVLGVPLGVLAAYRHNTWLDYGVVSVAAVIQTVPVFVLAPIFMLIFSQQLGWIDKVIGWGGIWDQRIILPVLVLAINPLLGVIRQMRAATLEEFGEDYLRTARAKGIKSHALLFGHLLKNALTPVVTTLSFRLGTILTGAFFVEVIFGIPGFGEQGYRALRAFDYPLLMAVTLIGAGFIILANFVADVGYALLDPRVRERELG
jgi:ABC-type dipeptide/oligopeptide/nickel transport system permease component